MKYYEAVLVIQKDEKNSDWVFLISENLNTPMLA